MAEPEEVIVPKQEEVVIPKKTPEIKKPVPLLVTDPKLIKEFLEQFPVLTSPEIKKPVIDLTLLDEQFPLKEISAWELISTIPLNEPTVPEIYKIEP